MNFSGAFRMRLLKTATLLLTLALATASAKAQSWNVDAAGNWNTAANWSGGAVPLAGSTPSFGGIITAARTVTVDTPGTASLAGLLFNNQTNSFSYTLSGTNVLNFNAGSTIDISSIGGNIISAPITGAGATTVNFNSFGNNTLSTGTIASAGLLTFNYGLSAIHTVSAPITNNAGIRFTGRTFGIGAGAQVFASTITGSGAITIDSTVTHIDAGGIVLSGTNSGLSGPINLNSGVLRVGSATALGTGTVFANGGVLQGSAVTIANNIDVNTANITFTSSGGGMTLSGIISGTNGVINTQRAGSALTLQGTNTYTGPTLTGLIAVDTSNSTGNGGPLIFSGALGSALNSSSFTANAGGTISLNNSALVDGISRVASTVPVNLNNGIFSVTGGTNTTSGSSFTQQAGTLTGTGFSVVVSSSQAATTQGVQISFTDLNRGPNGTGTFLFTGSSVNFGTAALGINQQQIVFRTTAPTLTGGIIPYAIGDVISTGAGTGLVTYDVNGVRLLNPTTEYSVDTLAANTNVRLTLATTVPTNTTINSLFINGAPTVGGPGTLTISSGTILATNSPTISNNLNFGNVPATIFTAGGDVTINGRISGTGGLIKSGGSTGGNNATGSFGLRLSAYNTYTGTTTVNDGFLIINSASALGLDTSPVVLNSRSLNLGSGLRVETTATGTGLVVSFPRAITTNNGYSTLAGATGITPTNPRAVFIAGGDINGNGGIAVVGSSALLTRSMTFLAGSGTSTFSGSLRLFAGDLGVASESQFGNGSFDLGPSTGAGLVQFGNIILPSTKPVHVSSSSQWDTNGFTTTINGPLTGVPTVFTKYGAGDLKLNFAGVSSFAPGTFNISGGSVTLTGTAQLSSAIPQILSGSLILDNTATAVNNRLNANNTVRFGNAGSGTLQINTNNSNVTQALTSLAIGPTGSGFGRVVLNSTGSGTILLSATSSTGYGVSNNTSFYLEGTGLNNTFNAVTPGQTALRFNTVPTEANGMLVGTGAAGTNTVGVLRGAIGSRTGAGAAIGLLTQTNTTAGARLLDESNEYNINPSTAGGNMLFTAATGSFATGTSNSVYLRDGNTLNITSANTLTVNSGTFLSTGGNNIIQGTGTNGGGATIVSNTFGTFASGYVFYVDSGSTLTVRTTYGNLTNSRYLKTGPGTLIYDPRDAAGLAITPSGTGILDTRIFQGTFQIPAGQTISNIVGNIFLAGGATLQNLGNNQATSKVISLNGSGGTLDLGTSFIQLTGVGDTLTRAAAGNGGALTLAGSTGATLILGNGTSGTPAATQPNTFEGGLILNSQVKLVINADSSFTTSSVLGTGTLFLNGGILAPKFATRSIAVPVEVNTGTQVFVNKTTEFAADTSDAGLNFLAPVRVMQPTTFQNDMTGPLTFTGSIYDNPYASGYPVTFSTSSGGSQGNIVLAGAAAYRGATNITADTRVQVLNTIGSATGTGNVTVAVGGTLLGGNSAGTAGFIVPANNGTLIIRGTISPGNGIAAPGILTVGAPDRKVGVSFGSNGRFIFNLAATNTGGAAFSSGTSTANLGTSNNYLRVLGDGTSTLAFNPNIFSVVSVPALANFDDTQSYSWRVAENLNGSISVAAATVDTTNFNNSFTGTFSVDTIGGVVYLNYQPVPEPTTILGLAALSLAGAGYVRRRLRAV
jgi:fibronectin-binding autotransporter adhesin